MHGHLALLLSILLGLSQMVSATELLIHPIIKPIDGSVLLEEASRREDFGSLRVDYEGEDRNVDRVEGDFWLLRYQIEGMGRDEIKANFTQAVLVIGGEPYGLNRATRANFRIPRSDGGESWLKLVLKSNGVYELEIVDEAALELAVEFDAEGFARQLLDEGRVSIYGILFATDSDRLLPGSGAALDVISEVLISQPGLSLEIQGHTDSTGTAERNLQLSAERAQAVKMALELFGVPSTAMRSRGYGASMPVADNNTKEGRQLNRRVDFALPGYESMERSSGDVMLSESDSSAASGQSRATVTPDDETKIAEPTATEGTQEETDESTDPIEDYAVSKGKRAADTAKENIDSKVDRAINRAVDSVIDDIIDP